MPPSFRVGSALFQNPTYSDEICTNIYNGTFEAEQAEVQKAVSKLQLMDTLFKNIPAIFFTLFMGAISDKVCLIAVTTVSLLLTWNCIIKHCGFWEVLSVFQ